MNDRRFGIRGLVQRPSAILVAFAAVSMTAHAAPRPWANKVPPEAVHAANPLPAAPETVEAGRIVYTNTCLPCHGPAAQGDGPAAQFIKPKPKPLVIDSKLSLPDGVMFWVITHGIDNTGMASFNDQLSENERWQAISYLHSLASGAAAPASNAAASGTGAAPANGDPANAGATPAASPAASPANAAATPAPAPAASPIGPRSAAK